jgi:cysteine desulfurase
VFASRESIGDLPIYLDWNATTPIHPEVLAKMAECSAAGWGNPSSPHRLGRIAREKTEDARSEIAKYFGAHPRDLLFVSGGTEANNLALMDAPALVTSELEHPSVTRVARQIEQSKRPVRWLTVGSNGQVQPESVARCLEGLPAGTVVAVQAVNHETGVIQPLDEVAELTHRASGWLHVDAVQAVGKVEAELFLQGDSFAVAAHKIRGPKGIGAMVWRCGRKPPQPLLFGGSQQRGLRPGTIDTLSVVGFAAAFARATRAVTERGAVARLRNQLEVEVASIAESNVIGTARVGHVSSLYVPGWRGDELVAALDVEGLCVSSGSACSAGTGEPSAVLQAMRGADRALGTIRISLGETTTEAEIRRAGEVIRRVVGRIHGLAESVP